MSAASGGLILLEKNKKFAVVQKFEWCLCWQLVNKVNRERIIVFVRNREAAFWKKGIFFNSKFAKLPSFRGCTRPVIITWMPVFATYRVRCNKLFCSCILWISNLKEKNGFWCHQFQSFDDGSESSAPSCDHFGRHGDWKKFLATTILAKVANWWPTD